MPERIVAIFPSRSLLTKALDHLMEMKELNIEHAAIVARANSGEIVFLDDEIGVDEGGVAGGTLGAAMTALGLVQLGALALPGIGAIIALGAGALVGGLIGQLTGRFAVRLVDTGYRKEQIEALALNLQKGHPALILEVGEPGVNLTKLRTELKSYRAEMVEPLATVAAR